MLRTKKKLIEVAIPLEAINRESAREKSIRHGHPSTLHLWWARRPLASCRAVLFASLVDDPSSNPEKFPTEAAQEMERRRLFRIIEDLVKWENTNNQEVLDAARSEILKTYNGKPPVVVDPFCGGGSIPLEAQRLGLEVQGSDLNPVAVLITKSLTEIPPKFAGEKAVHPKADRKPKGHTSKVEGLAEDIRLYGEWMQKEAWKKIGKLYPKIALGKAYGGEEASVIAWIWSRTVRCPSPACQSEMPLLRSFSLSSKEGKEAWIEPIVRKGKPPTITFRVNMSAQKPTAGTVGRRGARCLACNTPVPLTHIRAEGRAGRMGVRLVAMICEHKRGRVFMAPDEAHAALALNAKPVWRPDQELPHNPRDFKTPNYGMKTFGDLFTSRQLVALTTFSDLVRVTRDVVLKDAIKNGMPNDNRSLEDGGNGASAYADAIAMYLAFAVDRSANYWSSLTPWGGEFIVQTFGRQALPMVWDYAEANPFSDSTGNFLGAIDWVERCVRSAAPAIGQATIRQWNASERVFEESQVVCTDPPYYDNIGYADLSDFFYIWARRSLGPVFPKLLSTMTTPKSDELVATPYRFGGSKDKAKEFFENGLFRVFSNISAKHHEDVPFTIFYAFKQSENDEGDAEGGEAGGEFSTGWATFLAGLIKGGFQIVGTWPIRTEREKGLKSSMNALASSIVLVCRRRPLTAGEASKREFLTALKKELPREIRNLQKYNIAPVDLAQAAIGPGIAIYSRFSRIIDGNSRSVMSVKSALTEINRALEEILVDGESDFDSETRWALAWFEQHSHESGSFGDADNLARAKNTSVEDMKGAGLVEAKSGKVRILTRTELQRGWNPESGRRITVWEATQHLVKALDEDGEQAVAALVKKLGSKAEDARSLAYRLFTLCEKRGWANEAKAYNALVVAWNEIAKIAA